MDGVIYIVGNSRSGTTMMGRVFANHHSVHTFPETHYFEQLRSTKSLNLHEALELMCRLLRINEDGYYSRKPLSEFESEAKHLLHHSKYESDNVYKHFIEHSSQKHHKTIACKHTPQNLFYINDILKIFPQAKFIVMMRDPRSVLLSQKRKWRRASLGAKFIPMFETLRARINYHPITISKIWQSNAREVMKWQQHPQVKVVRYEDFLDHPQRFTKSLCEFVGLQYVDGMEQIQKLGSSSIGDENKKGIRKEQSENWKHKGLNKTEVAICERINRTVMPIWSYENSHTKAFVLLRLFYYFVLPFQLAAALLMNLNRFKNILATIKRRLN